MREEVPDPITQLREMLHTEARDAEGDVVEANEQGHVGGEEAGYSLRCEELIQSLDRGEMDSVKDFVEEMIRRYKNVGQLPEEDQQDLNKFLKMQELLSRLG